MKGLLVNLLTLYVLAIFGRIILSWFPIAPDGPVATVATFLYRITEPVLGPVRNLLPRMGMFDLSPVVVIIGIQILIRIIQSSG